MGKNIEDFRELCEQVKKIIKRETNKEYTAEEKAIIEKAVYMVYDTETEEHRKMILEEIGSNGSLFWLRSSIDATIEMLENDKLEYWENNEIPFKSDDSAIRYAVEWWGDAIENPTFDNGENSLQSLSASYVASNFAKENNPTSIEVNRFKRRLYSCLGYALSGYAKDSFVTLKTEYHPEGFLEEWDGKFIFPWKIDMQVSAQDVKIKTGANNSYETVFSLNKQRGAKKLYE